MGTLHETYQKTVSGKLGKELGITNSMAIPKLLKIVVNIGLGEALENKKVLDEVGKQLSQITGQKPMITRARKDISAFKLRRGDAIGVKVTLRGKRMYDFFEKLIRMVLPRIRDFRGVPDNGFDGRGSFTLGLSEQIVFPEIDYSEIDKIRGLEITFVTTGKDKKETYTLLQAFGMPFRKI
ncbi:50S ribosomal protein L5 [Candidatus Gottesmanbacteria bacterium]|nr:50S ribosomal protein L5 [Candidatus Gottesmanbacteria bacterium]